MLQKEYVIQKYLNLSTIICSISKKLIVVNIFKYFCIIYIKALAIAIRSIAIAIAIAAKKAIEYCNMQ